MYLIFNPEDKVPGDDIKKELPNIKNKCLNQSADQIKQKMIGRLDNVSWITPEFLEKGLAVVANASESIAGLKKEIEAKTVIVEEEKKNTSEVLARLEVENKKISGEKEIVEKATNEAIEASEQAAKEKEEADKAFAEAEPAKIAARNDAENIKKYDL